MRAVWLILGVAQALALATGVGLWIYFATAPPPPDDPPSVSEARLYIGGDVHFGPESTDALVTLPSWLPGPGIVNLEGPIAQAPAPGEGLRLVNAPGSAAALAAAGICVAGIVNNHALDAGPDGPARTVEALRQAGVAAATRDGPARIEIDGLRIAIVAAEPGVPGELTAAVRAARAGSDAVLVLLHTSSPTSYLPAPETRAAVDAALAGGAVAIAVAGSHALGPVERRGDTVIAWGLGNFAFNCPCTREDEGAVLELVLRRGAPPLAAIRPIRAGLDGAAPAPAPDAAGLFDLLDALGGAPVRRIGARGHF